MPVQDGSKKAQLRAKTARVISIYIFLITAHHTSKKLFVAKMKKSLDKSEIDEVKVDYALVTKKHMKDKMGLDQTFCLGLLYFIC